MQHDSAHNMSTRFEDESFIAIECTGADKQCSI